eukprot:CAMPEP_0202810546 /NCGR_PEP_ID=MMETSP1389-20130828/2607_1 /ASSEMBLY_ACC=CAM_ASM_000865 /TAXON_ID=302021 /ORGANISM="Rhodomonas sp., Strain CCMP768" /LENGTH=57 /DNA_ID=CAMNT_0049481435 /DNA_START=74 /DNA_END=248 /DNA_ORIENTATION=-
MTSGSKSECDKAADKGGCWTVDSDTCEDKDVDSDTCEDKAADAGKGGAALLLMKLAK